MPEQRALPNATATTPSARRAAEPSDVSTIAAPRRERRLRRRAASAPSARWLAVALALCLGVPAEGAQAEADAPDAPAAHPGVEVAAAAPPDAPEVSFNFKGATWDQVLDFFARTTGLPIVREVPAPDGTVDYLSPRSYPLPEALRTLNILLQTRGVMLRVEEDKLHLQKLDDMKRENIPTFVGVLPESVTSDQVVTVVLPLRNAAAKAVAEQLAQMVAAYGVVAAMEKQNSLVIVETAAQVRRLQKIIEELDREDVENIVEFIPLRHARATELVQSLTALMGERVVEYVINPQNNQRVKLEETRLGGMTISADARTNAIIARGTRARIETLRQTIELLDVPGAGDRRQLRSFALRRLDAGAAVAQVDRLFSVLPPRERPVVMPGADGRRVIVAGTDQSVEEAGVLLAEIDGARSAQDPPDLAIAVVALGEATPAGVLAALQALLGQQSAEVLAIAGADGRSVVISGPSGAVDLARSLVSALDRPARLEREVRVLRLGPGEDAKLLERSAALYEAQRSAEDPASAVEATIEGDQRAIVLVGAGPALGRFAAIVDDLRSLRSPDPEVRLIALEHGRATEVAESVRRLLDGTLRAMIESASPGALPPSIEPVEQTGSIVVSGQPAQQALVAAIVRGLDVETPAALPPLRIFQLRTADAVALAATLAQAYARRGAEERATRPAAISADAQTNALLVAAHGEILDEIGRIVAELNDADRFDRLGGEEREIRIFPLRVARADELARTIDEMFPSPPVPVDPRGRPRPELAKPREVVVRANPQTNSLIVDAPSARMAGFRELVEALDRAEIGVDGEIRTWRLAHADVGAAAETLRQLAAAGSLGAPASRGAAVTVTVEPTTRTLVVAGPREIFERVAEVIDGLDRQRALPATTMRFFRLASARAESIAPMLREVLAGRAAEDLGTAADIQALVKVATDRKTNTLIVSAPEAIMAVAEELVRQLDSATPVEGESVVRVRPLTFADAREVGGALAQALPSMTSAITGDPVDVRIVPSASANAMILVGPAADLDAVERLIEPLDARPALDAPDARTFELRHAEAERIAPIVQALLADQQETDPRIVLERIRRSRGEIDSTPRLRVEADGRTNRLIVSGPQRTVALAETIIAELDRPGDDAERELATFTPRNADPALLSQTLRQVLGSTRRPGARSALEVIAEPQSGALLLIGTPTELESATGMLAQWDAEALAAPAMDLRIVAMRHADAAVVAPAVAALLADRTRWPERLRQMARAGIVVGQPTVTAEPGGNRLLVSAPTELLGLAERMLAELDRPAGDAAAVELRTFTLGQADARGVADSLRSALDARAATRRGEPRATISAEPSSNAIVVVGTPEQIGAAESVVASLDAAAPRDQAQVRTLFLRHGRAAEVAPLVESLLAERELVDPRSLPPWAQADFLRLREQLRGGRPDVRIAADERLNAVVVAAPTAILDAAEQMVAQLDVPAPEAADERSVRLLSLRDADAAEVAAGLEAIFAEERDAERPPTIRLNPASNTLLVRATPGQFATIERVVAEIDRASVQTSRQLRTVPIDPGKATAREVAEMLERLLRRDGADRPAVEVISLDELMRREAAPRPSAAAPASGDRRPGASASTLSAIAALAISSTAAAESGAAEPRSERSPAADSAATAATAADVTIAVDERTNSLIVVGSERGVERIAALARQAQEQVPATPVALRVVTLDPASDPERLRALLVEVLQRITPGGGVPGDLARRVAVLADPTMNALVIAASERDFATVADVLVAIGRVPPAEEIPVRTIVLERASASAVAQALQRFYDERARIQPAGRGRRDVRRLAIVGDPGSNTILVAAGDADFAEIEGLVRQLDSPQAASALELRIFPLRHARATEIEQTVSNLVETLIWSDPSFFWGFGGGRQQQQGGRRDTVAVVADARLNALLVTGTGDKFKLVEELIDTLDAPSPADAARLVRLHPIRNASPALVAEIVSEFAGGFRQRRWWEPADGSLARVRLDARTGTIIVVGNEAQQAEIAEVIRGMDRAGEDRPVTTEVVRVEFGRASELATVLRQFARERAAAAGEGEPRITLVAADAANTLLIGGAPEELSTLRDLLARLDQPGLGADRRIEIVMLREGRADDIARLVGQQFPRGAGGGGVVATPDVRTNSLVLSAPPGLFAQVRGLVDQLDSRPLDDVSIVRTYELSGARAEEVVRLLAQTLELDARGRTEGALVRLDDAGSEPVRVRARVVADRRSNSIVVTATPESLPVVEALIARLDDIPARSPIEYRIVRLRHALAGDVSFTLRQVIRPSGDDPAPRIDYNTVENQLVLGATPEQFEQIDAILAQIDQPSERTRRTDFVPMRFAEAQKVREALQYFYGPRAIDADTIGKQSVVIVADQAANSLVISADEGEWEGIRALVSKLDSAEYDASQQLRVFPLIHADASSVARAINEAFQGRIDRRGQVDAARRGQPSPDDPRQIQVPTVLVESNEWVNAAPEPQTNSVIVSASRTNLRKIEQIVEQIDTADFARLPAPRIIQVAGGNPTQLAEALSRMFAPDASDRAASRGARGLRIVGDPATSTLLVRASDDEFAQVLALAEALQQQADAQGIAVKVLPMRSAPAARVAGAIRDAFAAKARQQNLPFAISVDGAGNALVVASGAALFEEVRAVVERMDALAPEAGQAIMVIDLANIAPEAAKGVIESIGLDRDQPETSSSRVVVEPIKVSLIPGRRALVVVAAPGDRDTVVALLKALDAEPALAESRVRIVPLRNAEAPALAALLESVLRPSPQQAGTPLARAVAEQVRRLSVRRDGLGEPDIALDLALPIRIIPDAGLNALVVASTPSNVEALEELIRTFDTLPLTEAVTVQIFPLENIAAEQFARIVRDLFQQGKALATRPGGRLPSGVAVPAGTVGRALQESIAITVDDRTNTVVVAGKEDSVALVEVLVRRLDGEVAAGWVEARVLPLRHADAEELAATLGAILADGASAASATPTPLQKQVARLRVMRRNGGQVPAAETPIEADFYQPMTRTVIRAEPTMNALVVVATPANLEVLGELVRMLDVEAASPAASVRVYPIEHASAAKLATTLVRVFDQQFASRSIRAEDRVAAQADERTNSLVVSTSPRSFAVLEHLLKALDAPLDPDLREIRLIELRQASAARLATLVQQLMDARLERLRRVQPESADLERVLVVADPRSNMLVVSAGAETFEVVRRLVSDLDAAGVADESLVRVITLEKGSADRIATSVRSILDRRYADLPQDLRSAQRPLVVVDHRSNSLLVAAPPEEFALVADLVRKLEEAPVNPAVGVHVLSLVAGRAEQLASRLQTIMQQRRQALGDAATPSDAVSIQADPASNALIVAASEENYQVLRQLVEVLSRVDTESAGESYEIISLTSGRAVDLVPVVQELYVGEQNRRRGADAVRVAAEPRLNAIVVTGGPGDVDAVRSLVARLEGARPETVVEIKYIPLASANAIETVALLESILGGRSLAGRGGRQATVFAYEQAGTGPDGGPMRSELHISAAIRENISLTPDIRTNTIVVAAPRDSMALIERMIRDLDESTTGNQNIRVFKLVNADAQAMSDILRALFNLERRGDLLVLRPREGGTSLVDDAVPTPGGLTGIELSAVPDERQQLSITVDSRTNSLLVSATPTYLDLVSEVVRELDAEEANERETNIYRLKNAVAAEVARVVSSFVEQDQRKLISTLGTDQLPSAARLLEREVTIVGDDKTNTVLINASPRYMRQVEQIIRELDVDPPQVLIHVLLAEVSLDATTETGVDMSVMADIGSYTIQAGFGLATAAASSVGVPTVPLANIPQVSVAGPDFAMLIKALQSQGRLQVLSNPSVMAANNEAADIQIGETVRLPESTSFTAGQQQSSVVPEDIGIILKVRPSINPDGFVRLEINPEISELTQKTTQISENFFAPVISRRRANTVVTVRDGETVVIGGLISDRYEKRGNKVPILGDIPGLGFFFRRDVETVAKTELLIVLTPHVIMSPSTLDTVRGREITNEQIDRLSLPDWMKQEIREGQIEGSGQLFDEQGRPVEPSFFDFSSPSKPPPSRRGGSAGAERTPAPGTGAAASGGAASSPSPGGGDGARNGARRGPRGSFGGGP
ncbi:MAG TPA: secretin N-terminal domain-containing protein [Phycisphaerales bacterium]|nr:secretin N-terminal domain-containing protein [Phycisphaerales bacterium]HMP37424.1 secretin N-terminal domain-containing protein [Phycisphaerales bacterium]